jgi:hypothetical protein
VTSLLPTPALLAQVVILKLSRMQKTVMVVLSSGISDELVSLASFWKIVDAYLTVINKDGICQGTWNSIDLQEAIYSISLIDFSSAGISSLIVFQTTLTSTPK